MASYQWTPAGDPAQRIALTGQAGPFLTYRFCRTCGIRIYATGDAEFMGGRFYALAVATLDDVDADELAAAPLKFIDNLHDRYDRPPADTRLL